MASPTKTASLVPPNSSSSSSSLPSSLTGGGSYNSGGSGGGPTKMTNSVSRNSSASQEAEPGQQPEQQPAVPLPFQLHPKPTPSSSASEASSPSSPTTPTTATTMIGRISPHLHLDLSCVAVPPLHEPSDDWNRADDTDGAIISGGSDGDAGSISCNSFDANIFGSLRRCRSDSSEATLNPDDDEAASASTCDEVRSAAARRRQQVQQAAAGAASASGGGSGNNASNANVNVSNARPNVEPPPWAVEAKGEARLEPVCESLGVQQPIDLTTRACFRVGRSPQSDVQLLHATSSRRHALLFHHPNGSCYVVDCGSAHGTFVNGVKVKSAVVASNGSNGSNGNASHNNNSNNNGATGGGMVIPHRVRRGALIRFGGPGAPSFVLKSFAVGFDALVKELGVDSSEVSEYSCGTLLSGVNQSLASEVTKRLLGGLGCLPSSVTCNGSGTGNGKDKDKTITAAVSNHKQKENVINEANPTSSSNGSTTTATDSTTNKTAKESTAALVSINTRLNALGGTSSLGPEGRRLARNASARLMESLSAQARKDCAGHLLGKHSYSDDANDRPTKRRRLTAVDTSDVPKSPTTNPVLVSPVTVRQSIFASPVPSSSGGQGGDGPLPASLAETPIRPILCLPLSLDNGSDVTASGTKSSCAAAAAAASPSSGAASGESTPPLRKSRDPTRRVKFSDHTETCYAPSVTPDEISAEGSFDCEEEDAAAATKFDDHNNGFHHQAQVHAPKTPRAGAAQLASMQQ